jgi:ubiquinone biosynthesis protein COQ4
MSTTAADASTFRMKPLRALQALKVLIGNPDDTAQVFTIIESLSGKAPLRLLERWSNEDNGKRLFANRPDMLTRLSDRASLERMPEGSLARAYLAFIDSEGITAGGLVDASVDGEYGKRPRSSEHEYISVRMRDTHDLWHTVTGYKGDVLGEASLLAFSVAQTKNPGVALIVLAGVLKARDRDFTRFVIKAFRDGQSAAWLPPVEWEELLPLPVDEVRRRLRIEPVGEYVQMRTSWLRETGELAPAPA